MSASRTAHRLVRVYPAGWRARYGEELAALVVDMSGGSRVTWRMRADVIRAGGRERLRASGLAGDESPDAGVRAGASLVLWAWALFVFAGIGVQNLSEHWTRALPGGGPAVPRVAFGVLIGVAALTSLLVVAAIALALPRMPELLRDGGWPRVRRRVVVAATGSILLLGATAGLAVWSHGLSAQQRGGGDAGYAAGFTAWALLGLGALLAWTAVAARTERCLRLPAWLLAAHARLAGAVAIGMGVMTTATAIWWITVADRAPGALTGSRVANASPAVPQLIGAMAVMVLATGIGGLGARRAGRCVGGLSRAAS